jgi:hypothetical protein
MTKVRARQKKKIKARNIYISIYILKSEKEKLLG